ncbi:MAG: hypothetical protein KBA31_06050 [Alphaproteobacteria bacterium]|nr:hypothetical protein [Alphaproteobacteria bacterium]
MELASLIEPFEKALDDPSYWQPATIWLPQSPESWIVTVVPLALTLAAILVWLLTNSPGRSFNVNLRDTVDTNDDWNIVRIRRSTAQKFWNVDAKTGLVDEPIRFAVNGRAQTGRLLINQAYDEDGLGMSHRMAAALGIVMLDEYGKPLPGQIAEAHVRVAFPAWRLDLRTWRNPNPDVRLQWKLGAVFLVAGILIPKALASIGF